MLDSNHLQNKNAQEKLGISGGTNNIYQYVDSDGDGFVDVDVDVDVDEEFLGIGPENSASFPTLGRSCNLSASQKKNRLDEYSGFYWVDQAFEITIGEAFSIGRYQIKYLDAIKTNSNINNATFDARFIVTVKAHKH